MIYFLNIPPLHDLVCTLVTYGLFCLFTSPLWVYVYVIDTLWFHVQIPLVTYSVHITPHAVHKKLFDGLFNTPTLHELFSISTTSLSPSLYIRDFFVLICLLTSPWRPYVYMKLFSSYVRVRTSGDLFCTFTSSYWSILYKWNFYCLFFTHNTLCWPIFCKYHIFMTYFVQ